MKMPDLAKVSTRKDLYDSVTVTFNCPSVAVSGHSHLLALEHIIAPLLHEGESVEVEIVRGIDGDYLGFA